MSESSILSERRPPRRGSAPIADYSMIVRVEGKPWDIRVFTDAQAAAAAEYAAENGSRIEYLPS